MSDAGTWRAPSARLLLCSLQVASLNPASFRRSSSPASCRSYRWVGATWSAASARSSARRACVTAMTWWKRLEAPWSTLLPRDTSSRPPAVRRSQQKSTSSCEWRSSWLQMERWNIFMKRLRSSASVQMQPPLGGSEVCQSKQIQRHVLSYESRKNKLKRLSFHRIFSIKHRCRSRSYAWPRARNSWILLENSLFAAVQLGWTWITSVFLPAGGTRDLILMSEQTIIYYFLK